VGLSFAYCNIRYFYCDVYMVVFCYVDFCIFGCMWLKKFLGNFSLGFCIYDFLYYGGSDCEKNFG